MKGQIDWLNKDLSEKTKELMNSRKEQVYILSQFYWVRFGYWCLSGLGIDVYQVLGIGVYQVWVLVFIRFGYWCLLFLSTIF
jgi:hypothetical protein